MGDCALGCPLAVRTDIGPKFTNRAFMARASARGIRHILIEPDRPMQNGYIESFDGRSGRVPDRATIRDRARTTITAWPQDYNEVRLHSSCQKMPSSKFAESPQQLQRSNHPATPDFLAMNGTSGSSRSIDQGLTRGVPLFADHILMPLSKTLLAPPHLCD